jgi:hypothetical protein
MGDEALEDVELSAEILSSLNKALDAWRVKARSEPVLRWLDKELDPDGVPRRLPVSVWLPALARLADAAEARPTSSFEAIEARVDGWFRAALRFTRPGGVPVFPTGGADRVGSEVFRTWAKRLEDPGLSTVLDWWFPSSVRRRHAPPPMPSDARPDRPLAILRPNWLLDGDLIAVDHRVPGPASQFELFGKGRAWLGNSWTCPTIAGERIAKSRPVRWTSEGSADHFEWSFRVGKARVVRSAVLLRGRRLAILGEQWEGPDDPGEFRIGLAENVHAEPMPESRGLQLVLDRSRQRAQIFPIGLPRLPYETDRGSLSQVGSDVVLRQPMANLQRTVWRPLVVSWDPDRNRKPVHWRTLTITETSRECPPGTAFAARITWGRNDTLLIYRSLGKPALRAFLGHHTKASFLVALFDRDGEVQPLVKVEEPAS